jgi:hypothetical protein
MKELIRHILREHVNEQRMRWTKELAHQEALKYNTKVDFKKNSPRAYSAAHTHKWIDDITTHMTPLGHLYKRMVYAYEFSDNSVYIGLTLNKGKRDQAHLDVNKISSPVAKHMIDTNLIPEYKVISDYVDAQDAQDLENCTIEKYKQEGWVILNSYKGGSLGACHRFWTKDMAQEEALKYNTKIEFKNGSKNAYQAAQKYGWLNDITKHMTPVDRTVWTYDKTKEFAKQFNSRAEMKYASISAYDRARTQGWLDEFFPNKFKNQFDKNKENV